MAGTELQRQFVAALRDPARPPPAPLRGRGAECPAKRFAVYRNNVHVSLVEAIRATYGVVERLVGEAFFHALARAYVADELPRSPVLLEYGGGFPAFIASFEPAASVPYLADVARLEWAWQEAYHAADAEPLGMEALAGLDPERLGELVVQLHPTLRLLRSRWPVFSIWRSNRFDSELDPQCADAGPEDVAVLRPRLEVNAAPLAPGFHPMLAELARGETLGQAVAVAQRQCTGFDLVAALRWLCTSGAIVGVSPFK
ncbi:DUF2063 domain-containing protein [Alkalilimnicola sp. S0819]|uniref:HvfC/BufC N-terminal domain-containing protein n=1 Tax=Alkalilimnicola sp. S0819 TaxID=2613922 RepID=UPI001261AC71|nr:DNA-binding domain-containing protein [Alkalilimnicola sp. S0819]KAB7624204.1 DUF2063 domain-containing protein [Alkalilimnicola sp. S0819]MPQ16459.1 DUF2063 domain-containing protein [Alkalilimnicola sp. S0819]